MESKRTEAGLAAWADRYGCQTATAVMVLRNEATSKAVLELLVETVTRADTGRDPAGKLIAKLSSRLDLLASHIAAGGPGLSHGELALGTPRHPGQTRYATLTIGWAPPIVTVQVATVERDRNGAAVTELSVAGWVTGRTVRVRLVSVLRALLEEAVAPNELSLEALDGLERLPRRSLPFAQSELKRRPHRGVEVPLGPGRSAVVVLWD